MAQPASGEKPVLKRIEAPAPFQTAYAVHVNGEPVGVLASVRRVPRGSKATGRKRGPVDRSPAPVTYWYAARSVGELDEQDTRDGYRRADALEVLLDMLTGDQR